MRLCEIEGCNEKHEAKGYCKKHYRKYKKYGDPLVQPVRKEYPKNVKKKSSVSYEDNHKLINGIEYKLCSDCRDWHPMNDEWFYKNKSSSDGYYAYCKECTKIRTGKWARENRDKRLIYLKKNNATPERKKKNREQHWKRKDRGYFKEYYEENKEKFKGYNEDRRAKNHDIDKQEWLGCKEYFNNSCAYCGVSLDEHKQIYNEDLHKEHVIYDGKNDLSNCVPACKSCNSSKHIALLEDWYNETNENFTKDRLNRIYKWLDEDFKKFIKVN